MPKAICGTDEQVVAIAKAAQAEAEKAEADASPSRWTEADCYAELAHRGWTQQKIAEECGTNQTTVSRFVACVRHYAVTHKRPSFWLAYREVDGHDKTTAERIVASGENEWYTPEKYVEAARKVLGKIDLDPASSKPANKIIKATKFYTLADDGLKQPWNGRLWLNPPYGGGCQGRFRLVIPPLFWWYIFPTHLCEPVFVLALVPCPQPALPSRSRVGRRASSKVGCSST